MKGDGDGWYLRCCTRRRRPTRCQFLLCLFTRESPFGGVCIHMQYIIHGLYFMKRNNEKDRFMFPWWPTQPCVHAQAQGERATPHQQHSTSMSSSSFFPVPPFPQVSSSLFTPPASPLYQSLITPLPTQINPTYNISFIQHAVMDQLSQRDYDHIFGLLSSKEACYASCVCKNWYESGYNKKYNTYILKYT